MTSPLGLASGVVIVAPYHPLWPSLFEAEAARITASATALAGLRLEHIGSTSVPGLPAKPIIDIAAGYPADESPDAYIERLVAADYVHRGEQGIPGRHFFRRGDPRSYHIHLAAVGGTFWRDHLAFRDILRAHDALRDEYASLKQQLASQFPRDREAYIDAKGPFIAAVLAANDVG